MKNKSPFPQSIVEMMNTRRYARKTITAYIHWIRYFIVFNNKNHSVGCHNQEVERFLSFLANVKNVAHKTQSLALKK